MTSRFSPEIRKLIKVVRREELLLIPLIRMWLLQHGSLDPNPEAVEFVSNLLSRSHERRLDVFHGSGVFSCKRQQLLTILGHPQIIEDDVDRDSIFDDGKWRHLKWQSLFYRMGILDKDDVEYEYYLQDKHLVSTCDGKLFLEKDGKKIKVIVELKGANLRTFTHIQRSRKPLESHLWQLVTYMLCAYIMGEKIDAGIILYENKNSQELEEFVVILDNNKKLARRVLNRLRILNQNFKKKVLPGFECTLRQDDIKFRQCSQSANCLARAKLGEFPRNDKNQLLWNEYNRKSTIQRLRRYRST